MCIFNQYICNSPPHPPPHTQHQDEDSKAIKRIGRKKLEVHRPSSLGIEEGLEEINKMASAGIVQGDDDGDEGDEGKDNEMASAAIVQGDDGKDEGDNGKDLLVDEHDKVRVMKKKESKGKDKGKGTLRGADVIKQGN